MTQFSFSPKLYQSGLALALTWLLVPPGVATSGRAAAINGAVEVWEEVNGKLKRLDDHSNAVIFIAAFSETPRAGNMPKLPQRNKSFASRVLAITAGESVAFPNADSIHHNVWSRSRARQFDLGLYKHPQSKSVDFPKPGIVTVFCNIHPQMISTILVLPNNKYALTKSSGQYRIEGIPDGEYPVFAWVEGARPVKQMTRFTGGRTVRLDFRLKLQRIPLRHLNKEGRRYKNYSN